jgi:Family of unknown function (DUF5675)
MFLTAIRFSETEESTLDVLLVNGYFECYLLEPPSGLRIPGGIYDLELYRAGKLHELYQAKFPDIHQGMILIKNVPCRVGVEMHIGNWVRDTKACLLTGTTCNNNQLDPGQLIRSTDAYLRMYPRVRDGIQKADRAKILIGTPQELIKFEPFNQSYKGENYV